MIDAERGGDMRIREEKQALTIERIRNDLKSDLKQYTVFKALCLTLIGGYLVFFSFILLFWSAGTDHIGFAIAQGTIWTLFIGMVVCSVWRYFSMLRTLEGRTIHVVKDEVLRMVEDEFDRKRFWRGRKLVSCYRDVFYFRRFGRVEVDTETFSYTNEGDTFYMVVLGDEQNKLARIYNARLYEYRENA